MQLKLSFRKKVQLLFKRLFSDNSASIVMDPTVLVSEGQVKGKTRLDYRGGSFHSFLGIPYARAPVGELRFKDPQPPTPWKGIRDSSKEGWECPGLEMYFQYQVGNEDNCLNLNIYTKKLPNDSNELKPVMVFIHGGGFILGYKNQDIYGPDYLITEDIVLVTINYRLGMFGFLSLEDPSLDVPGNAGLKDQVMALKWVQENIQKFNGDKNNVTVFGQSAGGASVHYLVLSPLAKGLFHKAIIQSGSCLNPWARGMTSNALKAAEIMGYEDTNEKVILEKLMVEPAKKIVSRFFKAPDSFFPSGIRPFGPVIEKPSRGALLCEDPLELIKTGRYNKVPMVIGYNSLEGIFYEVLRKVKSFSALSILKDLQSGIPYTLNIPRDSEESKEVANAIRKHYYRGEEVTEDNISDSYKLIGDTQFVYGIQKALELHKKSTTEPIYVYRNNIDGPFNWVKKIATFNYLIPSVLLMFFTKFAGNGSFKSTLSGLLSKSPTKKMDGTAHADEIFYLFPTFFTPKIMPNSDEDEYIQTFVKIWVGFAKTGNPNVDTVTEDLWKPIERNEEDIKPIFGFEERFRVVDNLDKENVKFWDDIFDKFSERNVSK